MRHYQFLLDNQTVVVHHGVPFIYCYSHELKRDVLLNIPASAEAGFIGALARRVDGRLRMSGRASGHSHMLVGNGSYILSADTGPLVGVNICTSASVWLHTLVGLNGLSAVVHALRGEYIGGAPWEDPQDAPNVIEELRELLEDSELTQELVDHKAGFLYRVAVETHEDCADMLRRCEAAGFTLEAARASVASCVRGPEGGLKRLKADSRILC